MSWKYQPLAGLCEVFDDGDWIETKDQSDTGIRLIQTGNVGSGEFKNRDEKARYISNDTFRRLKCTEILKGDCLISRLPDPVGRSCILPDTGERMITAVDCTIVRFGTSMVPDFFNYYSQSREYAKSVARSTTGATRQRISRSNLGNVPIPVPPIVEQRRIVAFLDEAFEAVATATANAEKTLANARAFFDDNLNSVFEGGSQTEKSLEEVCEISSRLVDPRKPGFSNLPHIGAGNIVSMTGELIGVQTAQQERLISGKFLFDSGMVLYSKIRPYLKKVCRPDFSGLCSADIYPLSPIAGKANRDFLYHLLLSKRFTTYAIAGSARAGMPKVNRDHLFQYKCKMPSAIEQDEIAAKFDRLLEYCGKLEEIYRQKLAALAELRQSILSKAFAGELSDKIVTNVISFPKAIPNITATDLHAGILGIAYQRHLDRNRHGTFQHVKAEKIAHMIEAFAGIELGREPVKDAAGPNDFRRLQLVQHRADRANFFSFRPTSGGGYRFNKKNGFDRLIERTCTALGDDLGAVEKIIDVMVPMDFRQAEIFATVYAAWNNLLIDGQEITDEAIVRAARDEWHPEKLKIPSDRFFDAIKWMRVNGFVPRGVGKKVRERRVA